MKAEQERKKQDFKVATSSAVTGRPSGAGSGVSRGGGGAGMAGSMGNMGGFHRGGGRGGGDSSFLLCPSLYTPSSYSPCTVGKINVL